MTLIDVEQRIACWLDLLLVARRPDVQSRLDISQGSLRLRTEGLTTMTTYLDWSMSGSLSEEASSHMRGLHAPSQTPDSSAAERPERLPLILGLSTILEPLLG